MGRCDMPNALARPRLACPDIPPKPLLDPRERAASLEPVEFSGLSISMPLSFAPLLCLRWRLADMVAMDRGREAAPGPGVDLGGAAAIGTTPFPPTAFVVEPALPWKLVGLLPAVFPPEAAPLAGDSPAFTLPARVVAGGVDACVMVLADVATFSVEFLRVLGPEELPEALIVEFFFADLVLVPPTGALFPEPRLRFLMTSVLRLRGLTTPCNFRNRPQALHRGCPSGLRRQRGVVWVKQFVQVVGADPSPELLAAPCRFVVEPCLEPGGEDGRLGLTDEKPEACPAPSPGGELGLDGARRSNMLPRLTAGVDAVRGTF